jgi:hypothetical protein
VELYHGQKSSLSQEVSRMLLDIHLPMRKLLAVEP